MCAMCQCNLPNLASPARRKVLTAFGAASAAAMGGLFRLAHAAPPKPDNVLTPDQALERLMQGNARYASNQPTIRDFAGTRDSLAAAQNPYACVLGCADSRVSPELCFDETRGDLFITRVAGNYVTTDILASLEYGVAVLKAPLIMVLGHTHCGAVSAAAKSLQEDINFPGHIQNIATALLPSVRAVANTAPDGRLQAAIEENVRRNVSQLQEAAPVLDKLVQDGRLKIVGGVYRLDTGRVDLLT